jgi:hypothetical protein
MATSTSPYLPPVVDGVPVPPDERPRRRVIDWGGYALLTAIAAVLFAAGWAVGFAWRILSWLGLALAVGFDSGRGR